MRCRHRANASLKRIYETIDRSASPVGVGDDCADGRESVFDSMVEFGDQYALALLRALALGDVNADADDTVGVSFVVIANETARLDPSHLATRSNDAILYAIFAPPLAERLTPKLFYPPYVVGVHASQAFAACNLGSALRKGVDSRIALRNLHDLRAGIIRKVTNEASLSRQLEL